jgi:Ca2+/Na+ antiporter
MGLRNAVMGAGALLMLVVTNPLVMTQVLGILVLVVLPSLYFGRRVRKLSRASQDRVADSSAIAAEVLSEIPVVQSYVQEAREAQRFHESTENAFETARKRTRVRSMLVAFIITATFGALLCLSFVLGLFWLLLIATEIVGVAICFGKVLDIPDIIMGLTVLAIGNSINDLAASLTIARDGYASMAVAGAYAGPMFNVLAGACVGGW